MSSNKSQGKSNPKKGTAVKSSFPKRWIGLTLVGAAIAIVLVNRSAWDFSAMSGAGDPKTIGPKNAKVTILEYSDFECPACNAVRPMVKSVLAQYPDSVKLTFRHYPLTQPHRWAMLAAVSAECAARQDKFWIFHDKLYDNQNEWSKSDKAPELIARYAHETGLDIPSFVACAESDNAAKAVEKEKDEGKLKGVRGTPTLFVGGKIIVGSRSFLDDLNRAVKEAHEK